MTTAAQRPNLSALAVAAQAGCVSSRDALLTGLSGWLTKTLFREVGRRGLRLDDADVEDLAQEILLDVWRRDLERYRADKGDFLGFVMARVRWRLTDEVRRRVRHLTTSLDEGAEEHEHEHEAEGARPDQKLEAVERELTLILLPSRGERALPDDTDARDAVRAYDLEERPLREVALTLGVHTSNASRARKRGLRLLSRRLPAAVRAAA